MSDLIERKKAIDVCNKAIDLWQGQLGEGIVIAVRKKIEELPSAQPAPCEDAVSREAAIDVAENAFVRGLLASPDIRRLPSVEPEIIRCKDCKHHRRDNTGCYYCVRKEYGYGWGLNDFCSDAERRTE